MLELFSEKYQLRLVLMRKHVILRLESLVKLVQAGNFPDQTLTSGEMRLFSLILLQSAFVEIKLAIACIAAILDEFE